jgi:hypothetical protein
MRHSSIRAARCLLVALMTVFAIGVAAPAYATGEPSETYNDVVIDIHGGNAAAFGSCVTYAKVTAKAGRAPKSNACKNFAHAEGGNVSLNSVSIFVDQEGSGRKTRNNVEINISGGDAVAVAGCVNYLQGTANADQVNSCKSAADAQGGSVNLKDVDITIIQL